jgi:DNA-binding transcriptional LysR family regulator
MNLNHLAVFDAVATTLSVTRAADRLSISQPAVSKQLKLLEKALKTPLVDRLPRGVRLTPAGATLATYARRIFALEAEAHRALDELAGVRRGRLNLAATTTIGVYLLPPVLVAYRRAYPDVEMHMEIHPTPTIARLLHEGGIDLGLAESAVEDDQLDSRVFATDNLIPIASPRHPLARKRAVSAKNLCREPFVTREVGSGSKSLVERALDRRGLAVRPVMSLGSTEAIKRAVLENVGVAIVSRLAVATELANRRLVELRVPDLHLSRPLYLLQLANRTPGPATDAFEEMLGRSGF